MFKDYYISIIRYLGDYSKLKKLSEINKEYKYITSYVYEKANNNIEKYAKKLNADFSPYLEDIITYYFHEKNRDINNYKQNTSSSLSLSISRILYNIILSFTDNYKLKNKNIVLLIIS